MDSAEPVTRALEALFDRRRPDGSLRWTPQDVFAARAVLLLDLARRGEAERLPAAVLAELGQVLERAGIDATTPPEAVEGRVRAFFEALAFDRAILLELDGALRSAGEQGEVDPGAGQAAFRRLTDQAPVTAPRVGEAPGPGGTSAQSLAQSLGVKVRI
jgi:hypothetical protein